MRRYLKTASNAVLSTDLMIDWVNRFVINDMPARIQLFDYKTKYSFQTSPGIDRYNMPLYSPQIEFGGGVNQTIGMYPVYQGFLGPAYIHGIQCRFETQMSPFFNSFPNVIQNIPQAAVGDGSAGPYELNFQILPQNAVPANPPVQAILRGHVDISGIIATGINLDPPTTDPTSFAALLAKIPTTSIDPAVWITSTDENGNNVVVTDCGINLSSNVAYGYLIQPGPAPYGNVPLAGGYATNNNLVNYQTGSCTVTFNTPIPAGQNIGVQCLFFQSGLPRSILYYNNTLTLRVPPSQQYLIELDAYLSPAAFLNSSSAIPFGYMSEYIALGSARKALYETGDTDQLNFYEPFFREQETLVWKRSQRQFTSTRTLSLYAHGTGQGTFGFWGNGSGSNY
jgi:hypothetical protein